MTKKQNTDNQEKGSKDTEKNPKENTEENTEKDNGQSKATDPTVDELTNLLKRMQADFENYKKQLMLKSKIFVSML